MMNLKVAGAWNRASVMTWIWILAPDKPKPSKAKKSEVNNLIEREDKNFRKNGGWTRISRIIQKGDTSLMGIEDSAYYINSCPKVLKQVKTDQITSFEAGISTKTIMAESRLKQLCDKIVDAALNTLNVEDGRVFNTIRTNHN